MNQDRTKRKLTAIFSADVVGYSRLMEEDEAWTIKSLQENRRLISGLVEEYKGRVIDAPGDNLLAEFNSVINAVECAVKIQQELKKKNDNLIESRRMRFRIGINLGDVVEEDGRIYGRGVNIAARLEALTEPGGICISRRTYDHVNTQLNLGYEYLGEHNVKNISEPIRVYRVLMEPESAGKVIGEKKAPRRTSRRIAMAAIIILIIIVAGLLLWNIYSHQPKKVEPTPVEPEQGPAASEVKEAPKTIAVIPFVNISSDPEQEHFVDGLTEELISILTKIPDLLVTASTSSFAFKGTDKTVQEIASVLGVDTILEGKVRKDGNSLRITVQLIRAADGFHLWSETYDRELKDIFEIQEDIANSVADKLKLTLEALKQLGGTDNVEAYELYLVAKGQYNVDETFALKSLDAALALDSKFALAWASKSIIHTFLTITGPASRIAIEKEMGLDAAQKAIDLEPNLAAGYYSLGYAKSISGDFIEAGLAYRKAIELTNEPLSFIMPVVVIHYLVVGYFEKANELLENMLQNDPFNNANRGWRIWTLGMRGETQRVEEEYERANVLFGDRFASDNPAITDVRLGTRNNLSRDDILFSDPICDAMKEHLDSPKEGLAELHRLNIHDNNLTVLNLHSIVLWATYFGDPEFAIDVLEKTIRINPESIDLFWLPVMKEVRQTSRFKELAREFGLVDYWNQFGWPDLCRPLDNGDFECD